jgi:hypothetical protein
VCVFVRCWGLGCCRCFGIGTLPIGRYTPAFPPYEQLLVAEVSGAIPVPVPIPVPIPVIIIIVVPLAVPLAPFSTGSSSFLAWCSPTSLLAANIRDPPCEQLLADMGAGAGLSIIIGVCCGCSSLVVVGPRSEGLGGGGGSVT